MNITPEFLFNKSFHPEIGSYPCIQLSLLNNSLIANGINSDTFVVGKTIFDIEGLNYLIIENIPSPTLKQNPNIEQFTSCFEYAEKTFWSIKLKDWEAFGINIDKYYSKSRELLELNTKCDLVYVSARTEGCWGGFPNENKLFLVCPIDKKDKIKEAIDNAIRDIG